MKLSDLPQPFGFYRVLTGNDHLHFGYWQDNHADITFSQAQEALSQLLLNRFPKPPKRILDVGCGLGTMAGYLAEAGYQVVAIAPSESLISYAQQHHPGPKYLACRFLDDHTRLRPPECYDVILFQESLQYFPQLSLVFKKIKQLLELSQGCMIFCDEVSYTPETRQHSAVPEAKEIERYFSESGFFVRYHERLGTQVALTCEKILQRFGEKRSELLELFGPESEPLIDHYTQEWKQQLAWYNARKFGYEIGEIRPSDFQVQIYRNGDEIAILKAFQRVFGVSRSLEHWRWKFQHSPFGGPYISTVWDKTEPVAHYTAYPVPIWLENYSHITYQVGDTFTHPAYRGVGRGKTSLLGRAVRHFHRWYCEGQIPFFYGFLTGTHLRFGQLFLHYELVAPVYEWILNDAALQVIINVPDCSNELQSYTVTCVEQVGPWADSIFAQAKPHYGWLVVRNQQYLQWRYQEHPDYCYHFMVVYHEENPVGWWLGRVEGKTLLIGDALFCREAKQAPYVGLRTALLMLQQQGTKIREVRSWFSQTPLWWNNVLKDLGFRSQRQYQNLNFCVTTFKDELEPKHIGEHFYFTQGDSDLF